MKAFFVSYNSKDKDWAEWISWQLEQEGYPCVVQAWDFGPGTNFALAMQEATSDTERTLSVLSEAYINAKYTQPEWAAAFASDPTGEQGLLVPVRIEEVELSGLWKSIVYIDLVGLSEPDARTALIKGVKRKRLKPSASPPFPSPDNIKKDKTITTQANYPQSNILISETPFDVTQFRVDLHDQRFTTSVRDANTQLTHAISKNWSNKQIASIETIIAKEENSITSRNPGEVLFSKLIPENQQDYFSSEFFVIANVDKYLAWLPWELILCPNMAMDSKGDKKIGSLIRSYKIKLKRIPQYIPEKSSRKSLIIGIPESSHSSSFDDAKTAEARDVFSQLTNLEIKCNICTDNSPVEVLTKLFAYPYEIIHIAGKGIKIRVSPETSHLGIKLSNGIYLTAAEFSQMKYMPKLIFLNIHETCMDMESVSISGAKIDGSSSQLISRGQFASAVASDLLELGVEMVIVTGWAIDLISSKTWIKTFYASLLSGRSFGQATQEAQITTFTKHIDTNTWGAFHCYGDPRIRLGNLTEERIPVE